MNCILSGLFFAQGILSCIAAGAFRDVDLTFSALREFWLMLGYVVVLGVLASVVDFM